MHNPTLRSRAGFTLIELLTVIAIIGILAAILFPAITSARVAAQKAKDLANIRSIGQAALIYATQNNSRLPDPLAATNTLGQTYYAWFGLLAQSGNLSDPSILYSNLDALAPAAPPTTIITLGGNANQLDPSFTGTNPSYEVIGGGKDSDAGTTPIAYTRGLQTNGTWSPTNGVYGTNGGGLIVFVGGNVTQYAKTIGTPSSLIQVFGTPTTNIQNTIPAIGNYRFYGPKTGATIGTSAGNAGTGSATASN